MEQGRLGSQRPGTGEGGEQEKVICALPDSDFAQRAEEVIVEFSQGLEQVEELPDGYALRFPGSEGWIAQLVEFVMYERDCCPFFAFELAFEPHGGPVWLRLRGEGVKEFLELIHPLAPA